MSNLLWKYFLEDDVDRFRNLLGNGSQTFQYTPRGQNGGGGGGGGGQTNSLGAIVGSPEIGSNASPRHVVKSRKSSGYMGNAGGSKGQSNALTKADLNNRDHSGLTLLHRVVSSTAESAISFALALIENPLVDIYLQDRENGWTALHRALYFGNVAIARALLGRDSKDSYTPSAGNLANRGNSLIKVKDNEGNSAFDVYNSTIARRVLGRRDESIEILPEVDDEDYDSEGAVNPEFPSYLSQAQNSASGDELFAFGSNKNLTLGFGDEDDRQHPERIILKRPDHLLFRFYQEHLDLNAVEKQQNGDWNIPDAIDELPTLIRNKPILIQDVALSKLHSALLTADLESNLYMCGFGPGGRLGTGDERTRFNYVCIEGGALEGRKVVTIALGQNHSIAVTSNGEVVTWGTNTWGTLGYSLPRPPNDEEPVNSTPRQIFGPLKKELVIGVAASPIHSVAHTSTSLYTWGKNEGQLGLMDSDSRSLEAQTIPRKVAASLFTSPIQMVSAINRATICLLKNHTVFVFANYGYNVVKFPLDAGFTNYHLGSTVLSTRYEEPSHISLITSGGDTIAAVSSRGDLFTLNVSQKLDSNQPATSTTNPAKIRSALSQPQRIWSLRKGNWDGIKSVGVGENGSVIICTRAGAVWRRVKRAKIKHVFASGTGDFKNKDFKFQRVPGLTNVIAVRSNVFGGYAAIRKDCDIMTQIKVDGQALWRDLAPLFSLEALESAVSEDPRLKELIPSLEYLDSTTQAVLVSSDIEKDAAQYILNKGIRSEDYDVEISTSLSETKIPVHGFMLAARGPLLRKGLDQCRENGEFTIPEMMTMVSDGDGVKIEFQGLDFITIFNLALYIYTDTIVDVWNYTKQLPQLAFRYRQIRTELMKLAANLGMAKLEAAVRSMTVPEICLNLDFASAIEDRQFFEDGDTIIELDGDEMMAHSALLRQRCPFFEGIFGGRAGGQWLHSRRELETDAVRIDLKHINPSTFDLILRYLYSDAGSELFDDVVVEDIDELCDLIMDVMSAADELMLDRLSQICQEVIGRFVNTRNICQLLNAISPCAVSSFKNAGLEYLCLQLETMLENHFLDELEEDLLLELDNVVRENQLACLPFAKSGRAEAELLECHPGLAGDIYEERQRKLRDMAFRLTFRDDDNRLSSSFKTRVGSVDDVISTPDKNSRKAKTARNAPFSPSIRPRSSHADLMFDMDDDETVALAPASQSPNLIEQALSLPSGSATPSGRHVSRNKGKTYLNLDVSPLPSPSIKPTSPITGSPGISIRTWSSPALPSLKLDMREIMSQASQARTSSLSMSISAQKEKDEAAAKAAAPKLSQKERKKQQQLALQRALSESQPPEKDAKAPPWQVASRGPRISLKDVAMGEIAPSSPSPSAKSSSQRIPAITQEYQQRPRAASPDTRFSGQNRASPSAPSKSGPSSKSSKPTIPPAQRPSPQPMKSSDFPALLPRSKTYIESLAHAEPALQLSMADIIGQQKREQDLIKEAVAKRSLQEIQEEQAFQEWWDKESERVREEEERRARQVEGKIRGERKGGTRGGKEATAGVSSSEPVQALNESERGRTKRGRGGGPRGRGGAASERGRGRGRGQVMPQSSNGAGKGAKA